MRTTPENTPRGACNQTSRSGCGDSRRTCRPAGPSRLPSVCADGTAGQLGWEHPSTNCSNLRTTPANTPRGACNPTSRSGCGDSRRTCGWVRYAPHGRSPSSRASDAATRSATCLPTVCRSAALHAAWVAQTLFRPSPPDPGGWVRQAPHGRSPSSRASDAAKFGREEQKGV